MAGSLPNFPEFDLSPRETVPMRFDKYTKRLANLFAAMDITDAKRQKAMFLHYVGEDTCDILDTLTIPAATDHINEYTQTLTTLVKYFEPQKCVDHHVYNFRRHSQKSDETVTEFFTRLQLLAKKCDFADPNLEVKRQIIQGTSNTRLRRKAIEQALTLDQILKTARAMESACEQTGEIEKHQLNAVYKKNQYQKSKSSFSKPAFKPKFNKQKPKPSPVREYQKSQNRQCGHCGGTYPHKGKCPAEGFACHSCGGMNHYSRVCRSKFKKSRGQPVKSKHQVQSLAEEDSFGEEEPEQNQTATLSCNQSDDEHYTFGITSNNQHSKPVFLLTIAGSKIKMMADSGASVSIINKKDYSNLKVKPPLQSSNTKVYPYMSDKPLDLCGKLKANISSGQHACLETFYVINGPSDSLLSRKTSQKLKLIQIAHSVSDPESNDTTQSEILDEFPEVVSGMGACKGKPVRIHVDPSVKPVAQPHRRIPFPVRKKVEEKLLELEKADIIEKAEGPTPWISPVVIVPKPRNPDEIRICVDMRAVNQAIIRERHIIPTVDDITNDLNGCKLFSKLDLKQGYHQIMLHPESRHLTTFSTHIGLWRYKRLNFGMSCSAEIFQKKISDVVSGIPGVRNISDDIYIGGSDKAQHDERLRAVLQKLQENNLTINPPKCEFRVSKMLFFGHVFSSSGISPDPKKVTAIQTVNAPTNVTEVKSILSSASFCSRYVKDFASITRPLRLLTHKGQPWKWEDEEQNSFDQLKSTLSTQTTLGYFDPSLRTTLYVDASPIGLGSVLTQHNPKTDTTTPIYFASYPLTATQARYPQIDREALAIYWAIRRFHLYLYGQEFKVVTDHAPLVPLFNNASSKPSARIEGWLMDLQRYRFTVEYKPGPDNPADYTSRHPMSSESSDESFTTEDEYVSYVIKNAVPKAMTLTEVENATRQDSVLQAVMLSLKSGIWSKPTHNVSTSELSRFEKVKDELTCSDTIVLKANHIVVPSCLQERIIDLAHEGHQGLVKTKILLREKVWFPCMDNLVESKIKSCLACQVANPVTKREPLQMTVLPDNPFDEVSIDFAYVEGENLLLLIDDYSRFPLVEPVTSTSASAVIPKLDQMFTIFGTPNVVKSDNGPPFNGEDFSKFAKVLEFKHRKVTPLWPRANGEVERFVRTLKKSVKTAKAQGLPWRKEVQVFLRNYRTTPHMTTSVSPSTLFLKRTVRNKLPQVPTADPVSDIVRKYDSRQKSKMKMYADSKNYVKHSDIKVGDTVLVKRPFNTQKGNTPYIPAPMTVTKVKGTMMTASGNGQ